MNEIRKARVGLLGLMFDLYDAWPQLKLDMAEFGGQLVGCPGAVRRGRVPGRVQ